MARLLRVLVLAAVGVLVASGMASAHSGHAAAPAAESRHQPEATSSQQASDVDVHAVATATGHTDDPSGMPCAPHDGARHSTSCCTIACHAALQAEPAAAVGVAQHVSDRIFGRADMLVGRSYDRTERPPKRA